MAVEANPHPNVGSQLDRALRALFISKGAKPQSTGKNFGIYLTLDNDERANPLRTIHAHEAHESTLFAGNQEYLVQIVDQFPAAPQAGQPNPELHRVMIDLQVGKMMDAMHQSDNGQDLDRTAKDITDAGRALATSGTAQDQANNADMAEFTCLFVVPNGQSRGHPVDNEQGGVNRGLWTEVRHFKITCCPSKILGYSNTPGE